MYGTAPTLGDQIGVVAAGVSLIGGYFGHLEVLRSGRKQSGQHDGIPGVLAATFKIGTLTSGKLLGQLHAVQPATRRNPSPTRIASRSGT